MKKVLATILAIFYLSTSMGATIHFHYCMGRLVTWGLHDQDGKACAFCGMPEKIVDGQCAIGSNGCCHDEHKQIRNDRDQKPPQTYSNLVIVTPAMAPPAAAWIDPFFEAPALRQSLANGPPYSGKIVPAFLLHRNFRI